MRDGPVMEWNKPTVVFLLLIVVVALVLAACGANTTTEDKFRRDCEKDGGVYTHVQNDSPMCTYE